MYLHRRHGLRLHTLGHLISLGIQILPPPHEQDPFLSSIVLFLNIKWILLLTYMSGGDGWLKIQCQVTHVLGHTNQAQVQDTSGNASTLRL